MNDSQRPKPPAPSFEVPDLELEAVPRPPRLVPRVAAQHGAPTETQAHGYSPPSLFDEDSFSAGSLSLDLDRAPRNDAPVFGSLITFDNPEAFELEPSAPADSSAHTGAARPAQTERIEYPSGARAAWPTGRALDPTRLKLDPVELVILADYGAVPRAIQLTPAYAYRVFIRQRELKRQLLSVSAECQRSELELDATLAELARAVRPAAEQIEPFRRLLSPLVELEQVASQRGQALSSVRAQLAAQSAELDAELAQLAAQITAEQERERDALRGQEERAAATRRAHAKLQRVQIEIRALMQVVEQKFGAPGGPIPDTEAAQLAVLRQRAEAIQPEAAQGQVELDQASHTLSQVRARLHALRQSERQASRNKQALGEHYQKELEARDQGLSEGETQQRTALAELGRGVLAAAGPVDVPEPWLEHVRRVSERADQLIVRREMLRAAIESYDSERVAQGVRLACTAVALLIVLIGLKLAF